MRPATAALLDQADAANAQATRIMHTLAAIDGTPLGHREPGPVYAAIISRLRARGLSGQLTLCPHLSYSAPAPSVWCAWAPGRLRCTDCARAAHARIQGTAEDRRCDHCRKIGHTIHADAVQLGAVVIDLDPLPPKCIPPVTVMFGLCPACQEADGTTPS